MLEAVRDRVYRAIRCWSLALSGRWWYFRGRRRLDLAAAQARFQHLVDLIVQLKLEPFPRAGLELSWHRFWLVAARGDRYFGTGAFSTSAFGFGSTPSNNSKDVGHELDVVASYPLHRSVNLSAGYAYFWGGRVFGSSRRDTEWVFAQIRFAY